MPFIEKNISLGAVDEELLKQLIQEQVKDIECEVKEIDGGEF
ncbi:hypothetical protein ABEV55_17445 [Aneurinibacillus thermoaerophilus]|nr:hypothetical protein [Aneurinibacillus thermoaerophilus]